VASDPAARLAEKQGVDAVPVVWVVAPDGRIVWQKNFTPHAWLRDRVKVALTTLDRAPDAESRAGVAQRACAVCGAPFDRALFSDLVVEEQEAAEDRGQVVTVDRVYLCSDRCRHAFDDDPSTYLATMASQGVTPEKVWFLLAEDGSRVGELCRPCGHVKGSPEFLRYWASPKASSLAGEEASAENLDLDPESGLPRDSVGRGAIR
jgi:hypothetical protein